MSACRSKVDRGAAFEIPTQNEGIVVQQGSQAVLTARHSLWPGERSRRSDLLRPVNNRTSPFFHSSLLKYCTSGREKGLFHSGLSLQTETTSLSSKQTPRRRPPSRSCGTLGTQRCTHPSMQRSPPPLVRCVGCGALLQQEVDTVNVAVHDRQHQRGSARGGEAAAGRVGWGNQLGSSAALSCPRHPTAHPRRKPGRTHWPWMSMTSVMSARSPLSIRRCRESVFPLAAGEDRRGEESHTHTHTHTAGFPLSSRRRKPKERARVQLPGTRG